MFHAVKGTLLLVAALTLSAFYPARLGPGVTPMQQMYILTLPPLK